MADTNTGGHAGRGTVTQFTALLFALTGALAFGWVVGQGAPTDAPAVQSPPDAPADGAPPTRVAQEGPSTGQEEKNTAPAPVLPFDPEPSARDESAPDRVDETQGKAEKPRDTAMPEPAATRGEGAIVRWKGVDAPALLLLEEGRIREAAAWLANAPLGAAARGNLAGRGCLAAGDFTGARAAFQPQGEGKGEVGADARFGLALCAAQGDVKAVPQASLEDLLAHSDSWGGAMALLEYARRLDAGLLDEALFESKPVGDLLAKGKVEVLTRYYYQQALFSDRLLLADERACLKRLQELTEQTILNPRRNHVGFGLPKVSFHKVEPGDSLTRIAKRYEVTIGSIGRVNGLDPKGVLRAGKTLKVVGGEVTLKVDRARLTATLLVDGAFLLRAPVGIGPGEKTPAGRFTVRTKVVKPDWYFNGKRVPFGDPENILGTRWLGFDTQENDGLGAGLGLHGTTIPESVPGRESLGCVRLHNEDVEFIYDFLAQGGTVEIR